MSYYLASTGPRARAEAYRFTIDSLDDKDLVELKKTVKHMNADDKERTLYVKRLHGCDHPAARRKYYSLRIRPRGKRDGNYFDTPIENAERFDVYIKTEYRYEFT